MTSQKGNKTILFSIDLGKCNGCYSIPEIVNEVKKKYSAANLF